MQTSLITDKRSKQLCLFAKKRFEHSSDICLKVTGLLNTVTSATKFDGALIKFFRFGSAPRFSEDDVYRPDQRFRLGIGARASTSTDDIFLTITAKQKVRLGKNTDIVRGRQVLNSYTQAKLSASYDYNVRTERWGGEAIAMVSHAMFRFSDEQDLRVTAGCRVPLYSSGTGRASPFVRIEENCWRVESDLNGSWSVRYAL